MDIKTLKYLEDRAAKGRALVKRINELKKKLKLCKEIRGIGIHFKSEPSIEVTSYSCRTKNIRKAETEARMIYLYIDMLQDDIFSLEIELAEL